ncbi:MAG: hypothetical protein ABSH11_01180 [Verrucomicrobiota bacterium]|jgi:hypothetical protein
MKSDGVQNKMSVIAKLPGMKPLYTFALLALLAALSGYASDQVDRTEAPDGFYVGADTASSYALQIPPSDGGSSVIFQIHENGAFIPKRLVVSSTDLIPGGYFVQVSGQGTDKMPVTPGIVIVASHKAYFGSAKRVGSSATVSLLLDNREEAEAVASMLEKRFSLSPSPIVLLATNPAPSAPSVQDTNQPDNWHWNQAMADALLAKANHDENDNRAFSAYSRMMYEARLHGMPEPPSQFPFPNVAGYAHHPRPDYVNFYAINDHYPDYLLCEYDVDVKNYNQSNEPKWFKAALGQIHRSGPKKFPPIKWVAVAIRNVEEHKDASTFEQSFKVGAIFKASDVFDSSRKFSQLIVDADMDRHPFKYDQIQPTPGDAQRWLIVERHAATNCPTANLK